MPLCICWAKHSDAASVAWVCTVHLTVHFANCPHASRRRAQLASNRLSWLVLLHAWSVRVTRIAGEVDAAVCRRKEPHRSHERGPA